MKREIIKKEKNGYAILFTVMIISIISLIAVGLSNSAAKQIILSSVARDSTTAFYQADIAAECAFFADYHYNGMMTLPIKPSAWNCGGQDLYVEKISMNPEIYNLNPINENSTDKCFRIIVTKTRLLDRIATKIEASGYNICNKRNLRTVERTLEANY